MVEFDKTKASLFRTIVGMGFLWSTSSLMVFVYLPTFIVEELGLNYKALGFIEGFAIFSAFFAKVFYGYYSDLRNNRTRFVLLGTVLTVLSKCLFALSGGLYSVFFARLLDRFSKGIRSAPSDALVADIAEPCLASSLYGYRQSLYTLGAVFGAILSMVFVKVFGFGYRLLFVAAVVPAFLSLLVGLKGLRGHNSQSNKPPKRTKPISLQSVKELPREFFLFLIVIFVLIQARFSEAFLTMRIRDLELSLAYLPMIIIVMDLVHSLVAYLQSKKPSSSFQDGYLLKGFLLQGVAQFILYYATDLYTAFIGVILIGVHMGMTQGLIKAKIYLYSTPDLRGTAFALLYFTMGIAVFTGNMIAGYLNDLLGTGGAFLGGSIFSLISCLVLLVFFWMRPSSHHSQSRV